MLFYDDVYFFSVLFYLDQKNMSVFKLVLAVTVLTVCQTTSKLSPSNKTLLNVLSSNQTEAKVLSINGSTRNMSTMLTTLPCNQDANIQNKLFASFYVMVLVVGMVGNSFAICIILFSRRLRSLVTYQFLVSLAVADMGFSMFVVTFSIDKSLRNGNFCHSLEVCYMSIMCDYMFGMSSVTHLLIVAIDRFIAINFPFSYASYFTPKKVLFYIASIWLYVIIWAALGLVPWRPENRTKLTGNTYMVVCSQYNREYVTSFAIMIYFVPMVVTTMLHFIIVRVAMQQASAIRKQTAFLQQPATTTAADDKSRKRDRKLGRDLRAAKTVAVVFVAYFVCWVPNFIIALMAYWNKEAFIEFYKNHRTAYIFVSIVFHKILPPLNSCLNPCIYFLFSQNFRSAFKEMTRKCLHKYRGGDLMYAGSSRTSKFSITVNNEGLVINNSNNNNHSNSNSNNNISNFNNRSSNNYNDLLCKESHHSRLLNENSL